MAGAKLATYYPVSIPAHGVALNITVQSYNGSLDYGFTACRRAVPDVDDLIEYLVEAHKELRSLVLGPQAVAAKPLEKAEQTAVRAAAEKAPAEAPAEPAKRRRTGKAKSAKAVNGEAAPATDAPSSAKAKGRKSSGKAGSKAGSPARQKAKSKAAEPVAQESVPPTKALN
jgi:hypothetical protein